MLSLVQKDAPSADKPAASADAQNKTQAAAQKEVKATKQTEEQEEIVEPPLSIDEDIEDNEPPVRDEDKPKKLSQEDKIQPEKPKEEVKP